MSHQLRNAVDQANKALAGLHIAVRGVPARREGFKAVHGEFARSVSLLLTSMSRARTLLDGDDAGRSREADGCSHAVYSAVGGPTLYDVQCEKCFRWWARDTPHPPR